MIKKLFYFLCANFVVLQIAAQNITNEGREFWVGYGHHQFMEPGQTNSQEMVIYLSAGSQPATVTVSISATSWTRTYNIPANTVIATEFMPKSGTFDCRLYSVPPSFGGTGGEGLFQRGINISSNVPIVAYAHTFGSASSGATMLMPIDSWGNLYYTLNSRQTYANNCFSWAYVVAHQDNSVIEITPSVLTRNGRSAGTPFTVTLNKGQIYQIIGANPTNGSTALEISGSKFKSIANSSGVCPPIAVFSGSSRTSNPVACGSGGGDNDNQQCFPTQAWGKVYLTAPTSSSTGASTFQTNSYKVLVKDPTTIVRRNGVILSGLTNNYYFFESNTADLIEADKPIMVAQFMTGGGCLNGGLGDPEMMYISPIEQGIKKVAFYRNTREGITVNYLTLILPTGGIPSLRIDGSSAFDHSYPHPRKPGYSVVVKRWSAAQAQATAVSDSAFNALTYGLGSVESYGYNAGTFLNNLNLLGSIRNSNDSVTTVTQHDYTCKGSPVNLSALYAYKPQELIWQLSTLGTNITPNANVTDPAPTPIDSVFINGVKYYKYTLPTSYVFNDTGTFQIPIQSTHPSIENCTFSEILKYSILVKATPRPTFAVNNSGCTTDTVRFFGNATTLNGYTNQRYRWIFGANDTIPSQNAQRLFAPGTYPVTFRTITNIGCVGDSNTTIIVGNRPTADFNFIPTALCEGATATFTDNSGVTGGGAGYNWFWDFGNGTIVNAATNANQTNVYPTYGTYTVKHVVRSSATCFSDTVAKVITVYAKPRVNFSFPTNCLTSNGQVQFTNTTTIPDGQSITNWAWTFNDPNANVGNPNTSNIQNPTHNYTDGTYNVNLMATSQQNCQKDTTIAVLVKVTPSLNYPALNGVCVNSAALSVGTATVTNGVTGTGVYNGSGVDAAGMFTPAIAGVGTHTIRYIFTSNNGCKDSVTQTILVKAKPIVNFTYPTGGCLPPNGLAQFNGNANLSDGQTVTTWAWDFNDPNANGGNPNTSALQNPTHNFTANGIYNIKLTVNSSGSCIGDTTISLNLNLKPALAYPPLNNICINATGNVNVATATVTNGASGTGIYNGVGTTSSGIFTPAIAGVGTHTIWFKFTTPNGCTDSISQTIQVKAKPMVNFTYPTGGCLPPNGLAQFNGIANLTDGQTVSTWAWDFNDPNATGGNPNTSSLQNPAHNFTANGVYNVKLTATSSGSCIGDTTIVLNLNVKPSLAYPTLAPVCQSVLGTINIATATVTNGATGTGVYSGTATTNAGQFNPSVAGAGTFTIWYKFTTPNGCIDSISQNITVQPKPVSSFTKTDVCQALATTFTNTSTIGAGTISNWYWDFGDGTFANYTNGNAFTKIYTNAGTYTVKLVTTSSASCVSDTAIQTVTVHPNPVVDFNLPISVCMPGNAVNITNQSTITGAGSLTYSWNFGDGNTSTTTNPAHLYSAINNYTITLTATSAQGCVRSASKPFNAFFVKPIANFSVTPNALCQGNDNVFTDLSTDPVGSAITNWNWSFGDGTTAVLQNPTKRYVNPNSYTVNLTVTNAAGCVSNIATQPVVVYLQPTVDAGPSFTVMQGSVITFNATANSTTGVSLTWSPAIGLSASNILKPIHTATADRVFRLTATGQGGCTAMDSLTVKVLKAIKIPNAFSPNGDGVNDKWEIENLADYTNCVVQIYNRYGQQLFTTTGYGKAWDGTVNGKPLPVATYYYLIDLKNGQDVLKGGITIVR